MFVSSTPYRKRPSRVFCRNFGLFRKKNSKFRKRIRLLLELEPLGESVKKREENGEIVLPFATTLLAQGVAGGQVAVCLIPFL